jgi:hypothetical protein
MTCLLLAESISAGGRGGGACVPGYRREVSSVTMSAAVCGCLASATPCPAHIESASIWPVVPVHRWRWLVTDDCFAGGEVRDHLARSRPLSIPAWSLPSPLPRSLLCHVYDVGTDLGTAGPSRGSVSSRLRPRLRGAPGCSDPSPGGSRWWRRAGHATGRRTTGPGAIGWAGLT